jgi:hypothetical protein
MTNRRLLLALLCSLTCSAVWAQDPVGAEFQVNSYTTGSQRRPAVASDANGNFVVVWSSNGQDGSSDGVFGQRFNSSGLPQGSEFQVNTYTTFSQWAPAVASDANGNFVVVWQNWTYGAFGQRFNAAGLPQGSEFQVNSYATGFQSYPAVASDANGNFVVAWTSQADGSGYGVFGQRFSASGLPQGSEFQVNSYTTGNQAGPALASAANGYFVIAWVSNGQDGSNDGVFAQRFNAAGLPQGGEFQVNSYTTSWQNRPAVAADPTGNFVVAWSGDDGFLDGVFGQRFSTSGSPLGGEFRVNSYSTNGQSHPAVTSDANGNFVVVWQAFSDGGSYGIFGRHFDASGVPQGSEFQVNSYTTSGQRYPVVASAANGNFVVVWESDGQDGDQVGVFGQRFGDLIFKDGFQ